MADKKKFLDHSKLAMSAPKLPGGKWPPSFKVQTYNNNIQFTIFAAVEGVKNGGIMNAGMDPHTVWTIFEIIDELAATPPGADNIIYEIENHAGRGKDMALKSKTIIGKDPEGIMFISIVDVDPSMPKVKFDFNLNYYHKVTRMGGNTQLTKADVSVMAARGWAQMFRNVLGTHMVTEYTEVAPYNPSGGGSNNSGGGYNSGGNSNAGGGDPW